MIAPPLQKRNGAPLLQAGAHAGRKPDAQGGEIRRAYARGTDVEPILEKARLDGGGAIDPIGAYRASGYRAKVSQKLPPVARSGSGNV